MNIVGCLWLLFLRSLSCKVYDKRDLFLIMSVVFKLIPAAALEKEL